MQVETGGGKRPDGGTSDQERLEYARAWVRDALQEWEEEKAKINLPKPAKHVGNNPLKLPEEYKLTSGSQWEQEPPELSGFPPLGSPDALNYTKEDGAWIKSQLEQTKQAMSRARGNSFLANDPFAKLHPGSQGNLWKLPSLGFEEKNSFGAVSYTHLDVYKRQVCTSIPIVRWA